MYMRTDKEIIDGLESKIEELEQQLRFAAGVISTMPQWSDKHPEEALEWIKRMGD